MTAHSDLAACGWVRVERAVRRTPKEQAPEHAARVDSGECVPAREIMLPNPKEGIEIRCLMPGDEPTGNVDGALMMPGAETKRWFEGSGTKALRRKD